MRGRGGRGRGGATVRAPSGPKKIVTFVVFVDDERNVNVNDIRNGSGTITPLLYDLVYGKMVPMGVT